MSKLARKARTVYTAKQKEEYAKLMVEDGYTNQQIMDISGAGASAVTRWKRQYLDEKSGHVAPGKTPLDADKRRIFELEKQLAEAREDIRLLKKASALFIQDNPALR